MTAAKTMRIRTFVTGLILAMAALGFSDFLAPASAQNVGPPAPQQVRSGNFGLDKTAEAADLDTQKRELPEIIGGIIKVALQLVSTIFFLLMVYAGFLWMTAKGESDQVEKAKNILRAAIIGLVIIALAYAITSFVLDRVSRSVTASIVNVAHAQEDPFGKGNLDSIGKELDQANDPTRLPKLIGSIVTILISLLGIIFAILTVYAGYLWMTARGDSEQVDKAKNTLRQGIIGLAIMIASYAITAFVVSKITGAL